MLHRLANQFMLGIALAFAAAASATTSTANPLVSVEWLQQQLNSPKVVVLDTSPTPLYAGGHIPGARNVDVFSFGARQLTPAEMTTRAQSWGVSADTVIVLYDQGGTYMAVSLFHDLTYVGMPVANLRVLDGGLAKWRESGGAVTKDVPAAATPGNIMLTQTNDNLRARLPEFLSASGEPTRNLVIDALGADYYTGAAKFFTRGGHVPNARLLAAEDIFNADKTFKSQEELSRMLAHMGATRDKTLYTYCGGGMAAALPYFVAKHMAGYPEVKLYKGSQRDWLRDARGLPLWSYPVPGMLRDREWVAGWNQDMLRAFKVADMNLIDIRSAERFAAGHIPYAINVPLTAIESTTDATALATLFANAGIDPRDETIIVSDGGINAASAKAFVALEHAGYSKLSLLMLSTDDWALGGGKLVKVDATKVVAVKPVSPPAPVKIAVATGKSNTPQITLTAPDALAPKLVEANGMPKSAYEIWSALDKAGVSRFANVTAVADADTDRTGNAAVSYVVLKLMGYPSVAYRK